MSEKGPFEAALIYLPDIDECRSAIRVLEAAGNVDKEAAMTWLAWLPDNLRGYGDAGIHALIESLPEPKEGLK